MPDGDGAHDVRVRFTSRSPGGRRTSTWKEDAGLVRSAPTAMHKPGVGRRTGRSVVVLTALLVSVVAAARPAGAAPGDHGEAASGTALEGGAAGVLADINLGQGLVLRVTKAVVVTPPGGGAERASAEPFSRGGLPPLYPAPVHVGETRAETHGEAGPDGGATVRSSSDVDGLTLRSLKLDELSSSCAAVDRPGGTKPTIEAHGTVDGRIGSRRFERGVAPNTVVPFTLQVARDKTVALTLVLNEQVRGQSSDGRPGVLVNALHIFAGPRPASYSTDGAIFGESRCEVAVSPIPPGVVPEAPFAVVLPLSAAGVGGVVLLLRRARRRRT